MVNLYIQRLGPADKQYLDRCEFQELNRLPMDHQLILDVGCGLGRVGIALMDRGVTCVGVDISEAMLQAGRRLDRTGQFFVLASATDLPFAARQFRFVTCFGLYEYIQDLTPHLGEVHRVMPAGGDFIFTVHTQTGARRYNQFGRYLRAGWSEPALRAILAEAGFSVLTIRRAIGPLRYWRSRLGRVITSPQVQGRAARWIANVDLVLCRLFPGYANELVVACRAVARALDSHSGSGPDRTAL
jgi:SAM-dependent methyltransferase